MKMEILNENGFGCASIEGTKSSIAKLVTRTERFQQRTRRHIDDKYNDFMPNHTTPDIFLDESKSLRREINDLLSSIGNDGFNTLDNANTELSTCNRDLQEILLGLQVSEHLLKIDDLFQCVKESSGTKDFLIVLDLVGKLRNLIYHEDGNSAGGGGDFIDPQIYRVLQSLLCYDAVKVKYHIQEHLLQQNIQERFDRLVQFNCKTFSTSKCVTIKLSNDMAQLQDIVMALFQPRYNPIKMCNFLYDNCLEPLILKPVSVVYTESIDDGAYAQLELSFSTKETTGKVMLRPNYKQVLEHINLLLQSLRSINISVSTEQHVFTIIGDHVKERMLATLVKECLHHAVPETMEEYQSSTLCEDVTQFEKELSETFFINPDCDRTLSEFIKNYDSYYKNRLCHRVLESAREIMQRDLQDMTLVMERNSPTDVATNPFLFPRCMVSKSVLEFVKLMELVPVEGEPPVRNSSTSTDDLGIIGIMLNAYVAEVPKIHEKLIESIPQQSVLFHNNCLYLVHWTASSSYCDHFPALIKVLHTTAAKFLKVQLDYQESLLIDIMKEFVFENPHSLDTAPLKLVRQCLRQLELLKNVWMNVLSEKIYTKSFCHLLNCFINELIQRVLTLRDISTSMASELSDLIDVVLEKSPSLFADRNEVAQVRSWAKLQQLKTIMNASLKELVELWCEGVGPLTANYKASEMKHLIRALFQDTERRSKAIMQIQ